MRLDAYLATYFPEKSRSMWQKYITQGLVKINGRVITQNDYNLGEDDHVTFSDPQQTKHTFDVSVVYEDENVIVFNKPVGMLTHAKGGLVHEQTIADLIKDKTSYAHDTNRPGIVHRLDRATSGILVGVKNLETAKKLQQQFTARTIKKTYIALVKGKPSHPVCDIDLPIQRNPKKPSQFRVNINGKTAQTTCKLLETQGDISLVELTPKTGRTHQLRVHMAHLGTPIVGDTVYGHADTRMFLHAALIELTLPGGKRVTFTAPLPAIFKQRLQAAI